jgi:hydroxypyruvate isomerase
VRKGFSANLSLLYGALPFRDRFDAAAADGFTAVEFWECDVPDRSYVAERIRTHGLIVAVINTPAGADASAPGLAAREDRVEEWREGFLDTAAFAASIGARAVNVLAGGGARAFAAVLVGNLRWAVSVCRLTLVLEPLNRVDRPNYLLASVDDFAQISAYADVRLLFDAYHLAQNTDDVYRLAQSCAPLVGHVQVAGRAGRFGDGRGAVDVGRLVAALRDGGYDGWVGLEYPRDGRPDEWPGDDT